MYPCNCRLSIAASMIAISLLTAAGVWSQDQQVSQSARVTVGEQAPTFSLITIDGETMNLETLRGEKPLVLIFFRGAW